MIHNVTDKQGFNADPQNQPPALHAKRWKPRDSFAKLLEIATMEPMPEDAAAQDALAAGADTAATPLKKPQEQEITLQDLEIYGMGDMAGFMLHLLEDTAAGNDGDKPGQQDKLNA